MCLSEPRDTTVLPCRHLCMCSGCARLLRGQTNRCPICRTPVEKLLEIKVAPRDAKKDKAGASSSQKGAAKGAGPTAQVPVPPAPAPVPAVLAGAGAGAGAAGGAAGPGAAAGADAGG